MGNERRDFLKVAAAGATAAALPWTTAAGGRDRVRLGFIGTGLRGQDHLDLALRRTDVDVVALCDIDAEMLGAALKQVADAGKPVPQTYSGDVHAYRKLLEDRTLDAVIIATPWEWHASMVLDALAAGIRYVGTEVVLGAHPGRPLEGGSRR